MYISQLPLPAGGIQQRPVWSKWQKQWTATAGRRSLNGLLGLFEQVWKFVEINT